MELGALVSRCLAVWLACEVLSTLPGVILVLWGDHDGSKLTVGLLVSYAIRLIIGTLLWTRAGSFGTWVGPEPQPEPDLSSLNKVNVGTALLQGVAAYWLIYATTGLALSKAMNDRGGATFIEILNHDHGFYLGSLVLALLMVVMLFKAKDLARML